MRFQLFPSLLSADLLNLEETLQNLVDAGIDTVHLDVMDNHYVPNLTMGPFLCEQITARFKALKVDVHLMASPVDDLIMQCAKAGAHRISIHPDASIHLDRSLTLIRASGCLAGLVLNPATSPECLSWCIPALDFVLVMTVNPGFANQSLIPHVIDKIQWIHKAYPTLSICVDGGVNLDTITNVAKAGATAFVMGSAFFKQSDYKQTLHAIQKQLLMI